MAVSHSTAARNAMANALVALVDQGATNPTGQLVIFDANSNVIATLPLSNPAFAAAVNGTCAANAITNDANPVVGAVPYRYEVQDRNGNWVFRGSCAPAGGLGVNSPAVPAAAPATVTGFFYQAPP